MLLLQDLGLVNRFQPFAKGSAPFHYVLENLGAQVVAAERGVELRDLGYRRDAILRIPYLAEFAHLIATNSFFSRLAYACRIEGTHRLEQWWSEARCRQRFGGIVIPDGYGILRSQHTQRSFFLELDRGTQSPQRLAAKLSGYRRLAAYTECPDGLLFCFPDPAREASARKRLSLVAGITLATASWDRVEADPLGPVWLPIGAEGRRRLIDLPVRARQEGEDAP